MKEIEKLRAVIDSLKKTVERDKRIIENLRKENLLSKERYKYLSKEIENLSTVYEKAGRKILEMMDERIGLFSVELENFNKQMMSLRKQLSILNTKIEKLRNYISSVDSFQTNLQVRVAEVEKNFSKRFEDVKKLVSLTSDLEKKLENLEKNFREEISKAFHKITHLSEIYQANRKNINEVLRIGEDLNRKIKEMEKFPLQLVEDFKKMSEELREKVEREISEMDEKFSKQIEILSSSTFKKNDADKLFTRLVEVEGEVSSLKKDFKNFEEKENKFFASYDLKLENFSDKIASVPDIEKKLRIVMERIKALEKQLSKISSIEALTDILDEASQNLIVRVSKIEKIVEKLGKRMNYIDSLSQGLSERIAKLEAYERKVERTKERVDRIEALINEVSEERDKIKSYAKELRSLFSLVNQSISELRDHTNFISKNMPRIVEKVKESEKLELGVKKLLKRLK